MLQCIDDVMNANGVVTFSFSDDSTVEARQDTSRMYSPFILENPSVVSKEQIEAIKNWSACPVYEF